MGPGVVRNTWISRLTSSALTVRALNVMKYNLYHSSNVAIMLQNISVKNVCFGLPLPDSIPRTGLVRGRSVEGFHKEVTNQ